MIQGRLVSAFYKSAPNTYPMIYATIRTLDNKKQFINFNSDERPYFYIEARHKGLVEEVLLMSGMAKNEFKIEETDMEMGMNDEKALKVLMWEPWKVAGLKKKFKEYNVPLYEADIPYIRRIQIDKGIGAGITYSNSKITAYDGILPKPRNLYVDIEMDDSKGFPDNAKNFAILCIGTTTDEGVTKYFTWDLGKTEEKKMLMDFHEYAKAFDYIVVWNKDFEEQRIPERCKTLGFWGEWRLWQWVDLAELYRMYNQENHMEKLQLAYQAVLKKFKGKLAKSNILIRDEKIRRLNGYYKAWKNNPKDMKDVNISHSYALYVMEEAMEVIALYSGVADEVGIFIEATTMNSHIVDTLAMRTIQKSNKKWIIPSTGNYDESRGFRGAVVFPAKRGVHPFMFLFDFTSLYNRIIQSYYIDPIAYAHWKGTFTENGIDEFIAFSKLFGEIYGVEVEIDGKVVRLPVFPAILFQMEQRRNFLKEQRKKYKHGSSEYEMYDQLQKSAKVVLLAFYGVLGMSSSRWKVVKEIPGHLILRTENDDEVDFRIPNEPYEVFVGIIPYLARTALTDTKNFFDKDKDVSVVYGDTDSLFIEPIGLVDVTKNWSTLSMEDKEKLRMFGFDYSKKLEDFFKGRFEAGIEMKIEKIFDRGIFGSVKKQYYCRTIWDEDSGWQESWYEYVKGLPLVRTDREDFLKNMQRTTLQIMLDDPSKLEPTWSTAINELFANKRDFDLIIHSGVKRPLDDYKNDTPAIKAAKINVKNGIQMRPGEKVAYVIVDVQDGHPMVEPVDEMLDPKEAVKNLPPISRKALEWYWNKRIWKNISPFLELVLEKNTITRIELLKDKRIMLDSWFKPQPKHLNTNDEGIVST